MTASLKPVVFLAPSAWASYLINGDASSLDESEITACDRWVSSVDCGAPVSCEDAGFCRHHAAWEYLPLAADCQRYTFLQPIPDMAAIDPVVDDAIAEGRTAAALVILVTEARMSLRDALIRVTPPVVPSVGDILVASWGYDQTNIDFYQVVGVTKSSVKIREIAGRAVGTGAARDLVEPIPSQWVSGDVSTRRYRVNKREPAFYSCNVTDSRSARLWCGAPHYQTPSGMGH